jgi:hypothetical protein
VEGVPLGVEVQSDGKAVDKDVDAILGCLTTQAEAGEQLLCQLHSQGGLHLSEGFHLIWPLTCANRWQAQNNRDVCLVACASSHNSDS